MSRVRACAGGGSIRGQKQQGKRAVARGKGRKWGTSPGEKEYGLEALLTDGAVGARIARAGAVTLVVVKAEANTDPLVLAWIVTAGVHCGGEIDQGALSLGPEAWSPVTALF